MRPKVVIGLVIAAAAMVAAVLAILWPAAVPPEHGAAAPAGEPAAAPSPVEERHEIARQKLLQMKEAMDKIQPPRQVTISGPERRPGESQELFEERQRAIREFNRFASDSHLTPAQVDTIARIIADAQDTWRLGLDAAHRKEPEGPGGVMNDPVLSQLITSINDDVLRQAREAVPGPASAIIQSYFPSMLPYARARVFETAK